MRPQPVSSFSPMLQTASMEVTPRTLARLDAPRLDLPPGSEVFVAHIEGTGFDEMLQTACRLRDMGLEPVPHLPARLIADGAELGRQLQAYRDAAGVERALLLAGGRRQPLGQLSSSMDLVETGHFDRLGFRHLYFAGHPEGSRDIDPEGGYAGVDAALTWKQALHERSDARMGLVTQFLFDAAPVIAWAERIQAAGIDMPIRVGLAGPARLQSLIGFALDCGVGASVSVLQRRARDIRKLLLPVTPDAVIADLEAYRVAVPQTRVSGLHVFPFGGLVSSVAWLKAAQG